MQPKYRRPLIFQGMNSIRSNNLGLNHPRPLHHQVARGVCGKASIPFLFHFRGSNFVPGEKNRLDEAVKERTDRMKDMENRIDEMEEKILNLNSSLEDKQKEV